MKQPKNKLIAVCLYFAPYVCAVVGILLYALAVYLIRNALYGGMLTEQNVLNTVLTYVPFSVGMIIVAIGVSGALKTKYDFSVIGINAPKKQASGRVMFFMLAICLVCATVSVGYSSSVSYVEKKQVGGSPSYYITETGFMGVGKTQTVLSSSTDMEYDGANFVIKLSNGKNYTVKKNTQAGKVIAEIFFD